VPENSPKLRKILRASQRVRDAEERLQAAREALYAAIQEAQASGVSLSAIARALGVTRQAIQKLVSKSRS